MKRISTSIGGDHLRLIRPQLAPVEFEEQPREPDIPETVTGWLRSLGHSEDENETEQPDLKVIRGGRRR
ncbi:MAG: hypothetical protein ACOC9Y_00275 [Chloroflexota bacterium]